MKFYRSPKVPEAYARVQWCRETFGKSFGDHRPATNWSWTDMRWYRQGGYIFFKNEEDLTLYLLRWS